MKRISRREARETALKVLYAYEITKPEDMGEFFDETCLDHELPKDDFSYELYANAIMNSEKEDSYIIKYAQDWDITRLSKITLSILRLCICEFLYFPDIPNRVSMNEYIELSKIYGEDNSRSFINGIINNVNKEMENK